MYKSVNIVKKVGFRKASVFEEKKEDEDEGKSIETHSMNRPSDKKAAYNH